MNRSNTSGSTHKREEKIKEILLALDNHVDELKNEVGLSHDLLSQGIKTSLSVDIEKTLDNPLHEITKVRGKIDATIINIVDSIFNYAFQKFSDKIKSVFKSKTFEEEMLYIVVVKNDGFEVRDELWGILNFYDSLDISNIYPVNFQFVPIELAEKITNAEPVNFDNSNVAEH